MAFIHIAESSGQQTRLSEHEARVRWREQRITRDSLYWLEGMEGWRPVLEYFEQASDAAETPEASPPAAPRGFVKDPTALTQFVMLMLWVSLGVSTISTLISAFSLATGQATKPEAAELSPLDFTAALFALFQLTVFLTTAIGFLRWIHRAHVNVRGLGATNLNITPGWAVGWFFVPIMNLWKPFQAMKELWQASQNPDAWESETPSGLLTAWWTLWLLSNLLAQTSLRLSLSGGEPSVAPEVCALLSDMLDIPLTLVALSLVRTIHGMQSQWAIRPVKA